MPPIPPGPDLFVPRSYRPRCVGPERAGRFGLRAEVEVTTRAMPWLRDGGCRARQLGSHFAVATISERGYNARWRSATLACAAGAPAFFRFPRGEFRNRFSPVGRQENRRGYSGPTAWRGVCRPITCGLSCASSARRPGKPAWWGPAQKAGEWSSVWETNCLGATIDKIKSSVDSFPHPPGAPPKTRRRTCAAHESRPRCRVEDHATARPFSSAVATLSSRAG